MANTFLLGLINATYKHDLKSLVYNHKEQVKVFWSSENRSFVFNQIFVYGTLMGVDYKSEKKI